MSRGVARQHDVCSGHGPCPPRINVQASGDTFVNSRGVHRRGDGWNIHCLHSGVLASGSGSVFTNSKQSGRISDPVSCGSVVASGSGDTFFGD